MGAEAQPAIKNIERQVDRKNLSKSIELLAEVEEIGKDEDTNILGLYPIIADKMDALYVVYYYSSFESMGDIIDRIGMSEAFQSIVNRANEIENYLGQIKEKKKNYN